jgi:hypothetical protein
MKHGVWLPSDLETQDHSLSPNVYASQLYGLDARAERSDRSLCIPCALTNHDLKQRVPTYEHGAMDEGHAPRKHGSMDAATAWYITPSLAEQPARIAGRRCISCMSQSGNLPGSPH